MIDKPDFLITGLCLLSSALLPSNLIGKPCENAEQATKDRPHCLSEDTSIAGVATEAGSFETLLAAAKAAGLVEALRSEGPLTVFAPTDDAFAKLPEHTLSDLLKPENKEQLAAILKYHVISGKVAAKDAVQAGSAKTLSGNSLSIALEGGRLVVNDANVIANDLEASNGIIHVIDSVLMPPKPRNIVETAAAAGKFKTLLIAAEAAGLADALKDKSLAGWGITVLAPTDEAFAKLPESMLEELLKPQNKDKLAAILKYHIIRRPLTAEYFRRPKYASDQTLLPGARVRGNRTDHEFARVNEANIVGENIRCSNGIIQAIDTVLMPPEDRTLIGGAEQFGTYKTLLAAVKAAGLEDTLRGEGPLTLFAPTDSAFAKLPEHTLSELLKPQNKEKLASILKYHIVEEKLSIGVIRSAGGIDATTLQGATVNPRKGPKTPRNKGAYVNDVEIIKGDFPCSNGIIIGIDSVLMPPPEDTSIVGVATKAGSFKTLLAAAKAAGLVEALRGEGPLTVFAPTDDAFAKLPEHTLDDLLKPENKEQLAAILKYHVISGKVTARDAFRVDDAKTLSGDSVIFSIRDGRLTIDDANVIANDLEASNGVIHVIDSVLMPGVRLQRTP